MTADLPFETILHNLLDIMDAPPAPLPGRAKGLWGALFALAEELKVKHCLSGWILHTWRADIPEETQDELERSFAADKARHALFITQIRSLAGLFAHDGIPAVFFKGSAGLVRNLYPVGWRSLSDIDVLVPVSFLCDARQALIRNGYVQDFSQNLPPYYHHIELLAHPDFVGGVEIHCHPYELDTVDNSVIMDIHTHAESVDCHSVPVTVPSITDHTWILFRTNLVKSMVFPRWNDVVELWLILSKGYRVDYRRLFERAALERVPGLIQGFACVCRTLLGIDSGLPYEKGIMKTWEQWSVDFQRNLYRRYRSVGRQDAFLIRKYQEMKMLLAALQFLPLSGVMSKMQLLKRLAGYEVRKLISRFSGSEWLKYPV